MPCFNGTRMVALLDSTVRKAILVKSSTRGVNMAAETKCLTNGAIYNTEITSQRVSVSVELPFKLEISEEEAKLLDALIHNQLELVLRPYFPRELK